jgi:hypothetical protein
MELAGKARAAETLLLSPGWTKTEFRDALISLAYAFSSPREAADTPIPDSIVQELARKRVALIAFADEEAEPCAVPLNASAPCRGSSPETSLPSRRPSWNVA